MKIRVNSEGNPDPPTFVDGHAAEPAPLSSVMLRNPAEETLSGGRTDWHTKLPTALAVDFDGTLIRHGESPAAPLLDALLLLKEKGTKLILASGRCVPELRARVDADMFDAVVAENGAILLVGSKWTRDCPPDWDSFRSELLPHFTPGCEEVIISADSSMGSLAEQLIKPTKARVEYNKDRLMIMPPGVDKGTGLRSVLSNLGIPPGELMCIGDGENDLPMFRLAGTRIALKNSVEDIKDMADFVTAGEDGEGTLEALGLIIDLGRFPAEKGRRLL